VQAVPFLAFQSETGHVYVHAGAGRSYADAGPSKELTGLGETDGEEASSSGDDDTYVSDSDSDAEGMQNLLQLLAADKEVDPASLVVSGKRQRTPVDYTKLNSEMFGDTECYDGEGVDDDFQCRGSGDLATRGSHSLK
jgi:hypothetical protein